MAFVDGGKVLMLRYCDPHDGDYAQIPYELPPSDAEYRRRMIEKDGELEPVKPEEVLAIIQRLADLASLGWMVANAADPFLNALGRAKGARW